ncbi:MAG TPA: hypothetical protein VLT16_10340 [Candidatus Limnocylindrales bacterium]|nr:hypothetical protein [Candidatus Limnocylindrales bacterium]
MKVDRDVIIDLLPAYFSGEASQATRELVEACFRDDPDFEKEARAAGAPLDSLRINAKVAEAVEEKLSLERSRRLMQTRTTFFWLAVLYSLLPFLFTIRDRRIVWIMFDPTPTTGIVFAAIGVFFWLGYFLLRRRREDLPTKEVFLWVAILYSVLPWLFRIQDHKLIWIMFNPSPVAGIVFVDVAVAMWVCYFVQRYRSRGN